MEKHDVLLTETKLFIQDLLANINIKDDIKNIINYCIKEISVFTDSKAVTIYKAGIEEYSVSNIYKLDDSNILKKDEKIETIKERKLDSWIERLKENKLVYVKNKNELVDILPNEYDRMTRIGINSFMIIPLYTDEDLPVCLCLINPNFTRLSLDEKTWIYLGREIGRFYVEERKDRKYLSFMKGIRSSNLSEFIVDIKKLHYEALRITDLLKNYIPQEGNWDWLINFYASIIKPEYKEIFLRKTSKEYLTEFLSTEKSSFSIDIEREVNGNSIWFRLDFSVVSLDENNNLESFIVLVKDITQMKYEEEEKQIMVKALSSIYKASFIIDLKKQLAYIINNSEIMNKFYQDKVIDYDSFSEKFIRFIVDDGYQALISEFIRLDTLESRLKEKKLLSCDYYSKQINWGRIILAPAKKDNNGSLEKIVFAIQDITEQKNKEEWMQYKMEHDELTGAFNRIAYNRLTRQLNIDNTPYSLILLDINKFKSINDTYGHDVGDNVLSFLTSVISSKMQMGDSLFRLGGDEFAIILNRLTIDNKNIIVKIIDNINNEIMQTSNIVPAFSISAGVTFSSFGYDDTIYHNADKALYYTKETKGLGYTIFEEIN